MLNKTIKSFEELGKKYGFPVINVDGRYSLVAKNTDGENVNWITYNTKKDSLSFIGNTDCCNLWFCQTRKDLTPDKIIEFVKSLNMVFEFNNDDGFKVHKLIDPEDWQEIANINDAYSDKKYYPKK